MKGAGSGGRRSAAPPRDGIVNPAETEPEEAEDKEEEEEEEEEGEMELLLGGGEFARPELALPPWNRSGADG